MKKLLIAVCFLFSAYSFAQSPVSERLNSGVDIGIAYSTNNYHPSIAYYQLINIGEKKMFSLGWTTRLSAFYGSNLDYYTAPARLTRGKTGFNALGTPLLVKNIDTVRYDKVSMTSLNIGIRAQINLGRIELGASADVVGLTIGKSRTGAYKSSDGQFMLNDTARYFQGVNASQQAKPSRFNARLLGDNNIGTLMTEVYARVHITKRVAIKAGYQWLITETTVDNRDIIADNDRFRNRVGMPYVAVTLPVFQ